MTPINQIKNGQFITLTTTEQAFELVGDSEDLTSLFFVLVSGTCQATVAPVSAAPILDGTYATWSTAGDKFILTLDTGRSTLRMRCASAGVVNITW